MNETRRSWFILKISADHGKSAIEEEKEKWTATVEWMKNVSTYNSHLYYDDVLWGWSVLVLGSVDWRASPTGAQPLLFTPHSEQSKRK